jgi:hypothetical protein
LETLKGMVRAVKNFNDVAENSLNETMMETADENQKLYNNCYIMLVTCQWRVAPYN